MLFLFAESPPKKVYITVTCSKKKSRFVEVIQGVYEILVFVAGLSVETNWQSPDFVGENKRGVQCLLQHCEARTIQTD